jgi:hypothetical protein
LGYYHFFICIISCNRYAKEEVAIAEILQSKGINLSFNNHDVILIVPVTGCSTCNKQVKDFIKQIDHQNFTIIASCYLYKDFIFSFSEDDLKHKNCIVDSTGQAFQHNLVDVGAKLFFFENGKIIDVKKISCTEPGLLTQTLNFLK